MKWYIKEFSALTKVSVPTLHHYDAIGLLKPSVRLPNGYRLYSEGDLLRLERIVALKFFGFSLEKIKVLVGNDEEVGTHLGFQMNLLDEQIKQLHQARQIAQVIVNEIDTRKTINWNQVVSLIEVYQMTKELRDSWAGKVYTEKELQQFAEVEQQVKHTYTEEARKAFQTLWDELFAETAKHLDKDPAGAIGQKLGMQYSVLLKQLKYVYQDYPELWESICQKHAEGKIPDEVMPKKQTAWLDKALKALKK
jgi:DNA-binding transcriptional MerR regulator